MNSPSHSRALTAWSLRFDALRAYTGLISLVGLAVLFWSVPALAGLSPAIYLFGALALLAELTTTQALVPQLAYNISSAVYFAALVLFGIRPASFISMVGGIVATFVADAERRAQGRPTQVSLLERALFNLSVQGLATLLAGRAYGSLGGRVGSVALLSNIIP